MKTAYSYRRWSTKSQSDNDSGNITSELKSDGLTPISSSGAYNTVLWSFRYNKTEKSILHAGVAYVPWITQLSQTQINTLEKCLSDPPTGSIEAAYPTFNTDINTQTGNPPPTFSSSYSGSTTAGDVVWYMAQMGIRDIPIAQPVVRYSATVGSGFNLSNYVNNIFPQPSVYSAATLISVWGIPSNYASIVNAISNAYTDPSTTLTYGIPFHYGWQKQPPDIKEQGTTSDVEMDFEFGLYPQNIFGSPL